MTTRFVWRNKALVGVEVEQAMRRVGEEVRRDVVRSLSQPGTGRRYGRRGHRASAPGEPPAVDTGRLKQSIQSEVTRDATRVTARVGTNVTYAPFLEFGTRLMRARPFLGPALARARKRYGGRYAGP